MGEDEMRGVLTEVILGITGALPTRPMGALWTMGKEVVLISNILKEVDFVFALEEPSGDAMDYGVSPALKSTV